MHSDTLMITGPSESRIIRGFYNAKIYKSDISGKADSIHMNQNSGLTQLINFYDIKIVHLQQKERVLYFGIMKIR